jgi:Integrase core domain
VVVDYFSRFTVAKFVKSVDITNTANALAEVFELLGSPQTIRSDNGAPFNGSGWLEFCKSYGITPEFSTPVHPQQNGLVERAMQAVNKATTIAHATGTSPEEELKKAIKAHNMAAHRTTGIAPEVALFGRIRRGSLPVTGSAEVKVNREELRERDTKEKLKAKVREDAKRGARGTTISKGDLVLVKRGIKTKNQTTFAPTAYTVKEIKHGDAMLTGPNGERLKRNVTQLKQVRPGEAIQSPKAEEPISKRTRGQLQR